MATGEAGEGPDGEHLANRAEASSRPASPRPATVEPLAPGRHRVRFTASTELRDKLERLQALMRSSVPDGDLAKVIDVAVTEKLGRIEAKRFGKTKTPRKELADTDTTMARFRRSTGGVSEPVSVYGFPAIGGTRGADRQGQKRSF